MFNNPNFNNYNYAGGMAPPPVMPNQTIPGVGANYYQQPMAGMAPPLAGSPEMKMTSILPDEDRALLRNKTKPTIMVSDEAFARANCDHKSENGAWLAVMDVNTGLVHCDLCGNTFRIATADKDTCKNAIEDLARIWETTKLLNINVSVDVMRQIGSAMAVIANVLPTVYASVYNTWMNAYKNGMRQYQGGNPYYGNSMYQYGNSADALSAMQYGGSSAYNYNGYPQQYNQYAQNGFNPYQPMQAPMTPPMGVPQQYAAYQPQPAAPTGPNPFCNNTPNFGYNAPAQQGFPYPAQNVAAPAYNGGAIDPAMMMARTMPAAAQQAAAPVNIPGATPPAQPTAPAATPAQQAPKTEGKFDV